MHRNQCFVRNAIFQSFHLCSKSYPYSLSLSLSLSLSISLSLSLSCTHTHTHLFIFSQKISRFNWFLVGLNIACCIRILSLFFEKTRFVFWVFRFFHYLCLKGWNKTCFTCVPPPLFFRQVRVCVSEYASVCVWMSVCVGVCGCVSVCVFNSWQHSSFLSFFWSLRPAATNISFMLD